jgi:class 3 adenylate cyclase
VPGIGDLLRTRYELKEHRGGGAQGTVWRAFDHQHHRDVALKIRPAGGEHDRQALLNEARTLLDLRPHAGLPLVRDDFFDGEYYVLVMDWVPGQNLAEMLESQGDPGLAPTLALGLLQQLATALDHLHGHRPPVVHGDVKPENVVLDPEGRIVLVDFGLVGMPGPVGTPGFVAPEVSTGDLVTSAADIYGLAATAVALFTGSAPVHGRPAWEGLDPLVVGALERGIRRGLAIDPDRRPSSASALIERLSGALSGALPEGVLTFCLTDIEGSTTLWNDHPRSMGAVVATTEAMVAEHVEASGGRVIKSRGEGDSTVSVFTHAAAAAGAAMSLHVALTDHAWPDGIELSMRMALHTGRAELREGDYYGPTLNQAARLRGLARGGQIVCSRVTAELMADDSLPEILVVELGEVALRGFAQSDTVFALVRPGEAPPMALTRPTHRAEAETETAGPAADHLPSAVERWPAEGLRGLPFIGRSEELERLDKAWVLSRAGAGRAVIIGGEPGLGKTRLAFEAARAAHAQGGLVLFGRCEEDLGVPYQPFVEAIGDYVTNNGPALLRRQAGPRARELGRILPSLAERMGDLQPPTDADAETERYLLMEAVVDLLSSISAETPTVLIIDDLQWAARPTLLLLRHLLHASTTMPLLVVATYRDTEVPPGHLLADALAELRRTDGVERMELKGLDQDEVTRFMTAASGHELGETERFAHRLCSETGGNPYFLGEILLSLAESGSIQQDESGRWTDSSGGAGDDIVLPETVREVITTRLGRLSPAVADALAVAAVIGQTFTLDVLEAVPEAGQPGLILDCLEEAAEADLTVEETIGVFRFQHALVRHTLYEGVSSTRRTRLHRSVALALEGLLGSPDANGIVELAHHFGLAAPLGLADKALDYARRAGDMARTRLAFDDAAEHYARAVTLLTLLQSPDPELACDLLIARGESLHRAGDSRYRAVLLEAAGLARQSGNSRQLGEAALAFSHWVHPSGVGIVDTELVSLLEDVLERLGGGDSTLRAQLLGLLAVELTFQSDSHRREVLAQQAITMARRVGDRQALPRVMARTMWVVGGVPEAFDEGMPLAEELAKLGEELEDREASFYAHLYLFMKFLEIGDLRQADEHLELTAELARYLRQPAYLWNVEFLRAGRAILAGKLVEAERLAMSAFEIGQSALLPESLAVGSLAGQLFVLRRDQGRLAELEPMARMVLAEQPGVPSWHLTLATILCETGHEDEGREHFELAAADNCNAVPPDLMWMTGIVMLADLAAQLHDVGRAEELWHKLTPYGGRMGWGVVACAGPVDLRLGMLAATLGRAEEAATLLDASARLSEQLQSPTWLARTRLEQARLAVGDQRMALATQALALTSETGAVGIERRLRALLDK